MASAAQPPEAGSAASLGLRLSGARARARADDDDNTVESVGPRLAAGVGLGRTEPESARSQETRSTAPNGLSLRAASPNRTGTRLDRPGRRRDGRSGAELDSPLH